MRGWSGRPAQASQGTSVHGALSKKPHGLRLKLTCSAGMMGKSSVRTWYGAGLVLGPLG